MLASQNRKYNVYDQYNKKIDTVTYTANFSALEVQKDLEARGEYPGKDIIVRVARLTKSGQTVSRKKNIISVLQESKRVLFTDSEYFNRDITGVKNMEDVKDMFSIRGTLKKIGECGNEFRYQLVDSSYRFTLKCLDY